MRISVVGTSGCGKSTMAECIADAFHIPLIELDAINWQADWRDLNGHEPEEFKRRVAEAVSADAWVIAGNYSAVRPIYEPRLTHVIWLDYPKHVVMWRVIWRSLVRVVDRKELWPGTGNRDVNLVRQPFSLSRTPSRFVAPPPEVGEHTDELLREFEFSDEEIAALKQSKAV